jgi:hypothetical protein
MTKFCTYNIAVRVATSGGVRLVKEAIADLAGDDRAERIEL